jgi:hypothetical protein
VESGSQKVDIKLLELSSEGLDDTSRPMPSVQRTDASDEVDVFITIHVLDKRTVTSCYKQGCFIKEPALEMIIQLGSQEQTLEEEIALLAGAGFRVSGVRPTGEPLSIHHRPWQLF